MRSKKISAKHQLGKVAKLDKCMGCYCICQHSAYK